MVDGTPRTKTHMALGSFKHTDIGCGQTKIIATCPLCHGDAELIVQTAGFKAYAKGAKIQTAFPELDADQRELLMTGTCAACWEKSMKL